MSDFQEIELGSYNIKKEDNNTSESSIDNIKKEDNSTSESSIDNFNVIKKRFCDYILIIYFIIIIIILITIEIYNTKFVFRRMFNIK